MAKDNNNINELVDDDDDPTVEMEIPSFAKLDADSDEASANTFDANELDDDGSSSGVSVSELKSTLRSRKKTISRLNYDIQQLHAKWLGLETEIGARETQTDRLNADLLAALDTVARKEILIKKRDRKIKSLQFEIRQRDNESRQLFRRLDDIQNKPEESLPVLELPVVDDACAPDETASERYTAGELQDRLNRTERYADSIRQRSQDLIASNARAERQLERLSQQLDQEMQQNQKLSDELANSVAKADSLQTSLGSIEARHEDEIRLLRFEVGAAQDTVVETEELNNQLASDLVDARGFKEELERMIGEVEAQAAERIEKQQKEIGKLTRTADSYEQKLTTKSEAISILLAELAKKSEQVDAIGEIEEVVQDIDERMSERSSRNDQHDPQPHADRTTRLLIGTVDGQVLRFPLFKDRLTIGRTNDNDIQLKVAYVSRRHAVIETEGNITRIIDSGSKNGVQVNSGKVSQHQLRHGDSVSVGSARFRYEELRKRES